MNQKNSKDSQANTAYHFEFAFRKEAGVFVENLPFAPNLYPAGFQLRQWMIREGSLTFQPHNWKGRSPSFTNPYSYDSSILILAFSEVISHATEFANRDDFRDDAEAEITYIRLYTELVLYSSRLLEALIKQMLYCTTFHEGEYRNSALGALLERNCNSCKPFKEKRHKITYLGSLAHRYGFCGGYENCLNSHMNIVRKRRNVEAAHSSTVEFRERTISESKELMKTQLEALGIDLIHMLKHIGDIEVLMIRELEYYIGGGLITPGYVVNSEHKIPKK